MASAAGTVIDSRVRPWGFWLTLTFSLMAIGVNWLLPIVAWPGLCSMAGRPGLSLAEPWAADHLGLLVSVFAWLYTAVCLILLGAFICLRRGDTITNYLALQPVSWRSLAGWVIAVAAYSVVADGAVYLAGHPIVSDLSIEITKTAIVPPLLWSALLLAAPIGEELLCRGFMFRGLQASACGAVGAILVPAFIWAIAHVQYEWYRIASIFGGGILLGFARLRSRSVIPPLVMHSFVNFIALLEVSFVIR